MSVVAAAVIGSTVVSAGVSIYGAKKAADAQADAAEAAGDYQAAAQERAIGLQREMWEQGRDDTAPWREGGADAFRQLAAKVAEGPGDYTEFDYESSPGYQFRMDEGQKAIERSAAAKGGLFSGAQGKALNTYAQNMAAGDYNQQRSNYLKEYYDSLRPLQSMAGIGQTTATGDASRSAGYGNAVANIMQSGAAGQAQAALYGGDADASRYTNTSNAITGALNSGMNNFMMWKYMNPTTSKGAPPANNMPTTYA